MRIQPKPNRKLPNATYYNEHASNGSRVKPERTEFISDQGSYISNTSYHCSENVDVLCTV